MERANYLKIKNEGKLFIALATARYAIIGSIIKRVGCGENNPSSHGLQIAVVIVASVCARRVKAWPGGVALSTEVWALYVAGRLA